MKNRLIYAVTQNSWFSITFYIAAGLGIYAGIVSEPFLLYWSIGSILFFIVLNFFSYKK